MARTESWRLEVYLNGTLQGVAAEGFMTIPGCGPAQRTDAPLQPRAW